MTHNLTFTSLIFIAGLALGIFVRGNSQPPLPETTTHAADMAAIEKLHKADVDATLTQDLSMLTTLWSEDAINLGFPDGPVYGIKAMKAAYEKTKVDYPEFRVLKYTPEITQVEIVDGWALEVGNTVASFKMSAKDDPINVDQKGGMRLLKRQPDGSWKFALVGMK